MTGSIGPGITPHSINVVMMSCITKFISLFILLLVITPCVVAQKTDPPTESMTCGSTTVPVPELYRIRLGMSHKDFGRILEWELDFLRAHDQLGRLWESKSRGAFAYYDKNKYRELEKASLMFLDESLVDINIEYNSFAKWKNESEFKTAIVETLKLPREGWKGTSPTTLDCNDFRIVLITGSAGGGGQLRIARQGLEEEIAQREKETNRERRGETLGETLAWINGKLTGYAADTFETKDVKGATVNSAYKFEPIDLKSCTISWLITRQRSSEGITTPDSIKEYTAQLANLNPSSLSAYQADRLEGLWNLDLMSLPDRTKITEQSYIIQKGTKTKGEFREVDVFSFKFNDKHIIQRIARAFEYAIKLCADKK